MQHGPLKRCCLTTTRCNNKEDLYLKLTSAPCECHVIPVMKLRSVFPGQNLGRVWCKSWKGERSEAAGTSFMISHFPPEGTVRSHENTGQWVLSACHKSTMQVSQTPVTFESTGALSRV